MTLIPEARTPSRHQHGLAFLAYLAVTLLMTYPVARAFRTEVTGAGGDTYTFVWNLWWVRKALLDPALAVFHTDYLFHPGGVSLAFHSLTLLNGVLSVPLQPLVGLTGAYNVLLLAGFLFGAWGAYLLAWELTGRRVPAVFAGFAFGFSPYHVSNAMVDLNIATIQFLPLTLYFVVRFRRTRRWLDVAGAGACLGLTGLADWYYLVFASGATAVLAAGWWLAAGRPRPRRELLRRIAAAGVLAGALLLPVLVPLAREMGRGTSFENPGREHAFSADLLAYLVPSPFQPALRAAVSPFYTRLGGNVFENTVTTGLVVLGFAILGAIGARRRDAGGRVPWLVLGASSFLLSLGPALQVAGTSLGRGGYLPFAWFIEHVPVFEHLRVPSRFAVLVSLAAAMLAAFGLADLLDLARRRRVPLAIAAFLLAAFEFWSAPFPLTHIPVPAFFEALAKDPGDYAILTLPTAEWGATVLAMDYQTVHGKRLVNGFVARLPAGTRESLAAWDRLPPDRVRLVRDRVRFIVFLTPGGASPWQVEAMRIFDRIPWLHAVDARDPSIAVYLVDWGAS